MWYNKNMKNEFAIELGTSQTTIFLKGSGLVLKEPSVIAFNDGSVLALGTEAKKLIGKTSKDVEFVHPFSDGIIKDEIASIVLLKNFISKIIVHGIFPTHMKAVFSVPCGMKEDERVLIEKVAYKCGIDEVLFAPTVICSKASFGLDLKLNEAVLVCDIGGGKCDIAIVSKHTILSGVTLSFGGNDMDIALCRFIEKTYGLKISLEACEKLKIECGSLFTNDKSNMEVCGIDVKTKSPRTEVLFASDVRCAVIDFYMDIIKKIGLVIASASEAVMSDLLKNGILLTGGASQILGLDTLIKNELGIPVRRADDAENCSILGAGQLLSDEKMLYLINKDN